MVLIMPCLLQGLREIHSELFTGKNGKPVIPFDRFCREHVKNMKKHGVIFRWVLGALPDRRAPYCGWDTEIMNYFRALAQRKEEKKQEEKER